MRKKHQPPSRLRYAATHPTIGIHVTLEEREVLRTLSETTGLSVTQLTKQALGVLKADVEAVRKRGMQDGIRKGKAAGRTEGYAQGRSEGYATAKARYAVAYPCAKCGGDIVMRAGLADAIESVRMLRTAGWAHKNFPSPRSRGSRPSLRRDDPMTGKSRAGHMRVALYARVSTRDKDQDPEVQLAPMRDYAAARGWDCAVYIDVASAADLAGRSAWARLLTDTRQRRIDLVLVWKLDRAFRSTLHCLRTLETWQRLGVGFACLTQDVDTTSPEGQLLLTILAAVAEFERTLIAERVQGRHEQCSAARCTDWAATR